MPWPATSAFRRAPGQARHGHVPWLLVHAAPPTCANEASEIEAIRGALFLCQRLCLLPDQHRRADAGAVRLGVRRYFTGDHGREAFVNGRLSDWGVAPSYPLVIGLVLAAVSAALLLAMALAGWMPLSLAVSLLILGTLAFGLVAPPAQVRPIRAQASSEDCRIIGAIRIEDGAVIGAVGSAGELVANGHPARDEPASFGWR